MLADVELFMVYCVVILNVFCFCFLIGWIQEFKEYQNFDECLAYIEECMIKLGPFDGLLGFSQVCVCISLIILRFWIFVSSSCSVLMF